MAHSLHTLSTSLILLLLDEENLAPKQTCISVSGAYPYTTQTSTYTLKPCFCLVTHKVLIPVCLFIVLKNSFGTFDIKFKGLCDRKLRHKHVPQDTSDTIL